MRILLMTHNDDQFLEAAVPLRRRGHEVVGCHPEGAAQDRWPCVAIDSSCPLDAGVDAAVVLSRAEHRPEEGVSCALRQRIPLVVGGPAPAALADRADRVVDRVDDSLADAVKEAAVLPHQGLSATATGAVADIAERTGLGGDVRAEVYRRRRDLDVMMRGLDGADAAARARCAQAAFAAVRRAVPVGAVDTINVGTATP